MLTVIQAEEVDYRAIQTAQALYMKQNVVTPLRKIKRLSLSISVGALPNLCFPRQLIQHDTLIYSL